MKICSNCKENKPNDNFHVRARSSDGLDYWCKACKKNKEQSYNFKPNYDIGSKSCQACKENKSAHDFYLCKRNPDGLENRCKHCCNKRSRKNEIQKKYGITQEEYQLMLKNQNMQCKICDTIDPGNGKSRMFIDHCHKTNAVRGLLCSNCNFALGLMKDDPNLLLKAAEYLNEST